MKKNCRSTRFAMLFMFGVSFCLLVSPSFASVLQKDVNKGYVEGEVIVATKTSPVLTGETVLTKQFFTAQAEDIASSVQGSLEKVFYSINKATDNNVFVVRHKTKTSEELIRGLSVNSDVLTVSKNYIVSKSQLPNDPRFTSQWGLNSAIKAWDTTTGDKKIYVAVFDTGVKWNHEDLAENMGKDKNGQFGKNTIDGNDNTLDGDGHGTHVAGIIGAVGNNGIGVTGVNWSVSILPVKVLDDTGYGTDVSIMEGIDYVLSQKQQKLNIKVANFSLGGWREIIKKPDIDPLGMSFKALSDSGILSVIAAGNEGQDIENPTGYIDNNSWVNLEGMRPYPASFRFSNIITVAAVGKNRTRSLFSNYSPSFVHIGAPGENILSTGHADEKYVFKSGTSMATPYVAGAIALLLALDNSLSAAELKTRILEYCSLESALTGIVSSKGILDISKAVEAASPIYVPVTRIRLKETDLTVSVNDSVLLEYEIFPENATNKTVFLHSENEKIASVDSIGNILGIGQGTTNIFATTEDGGFSDSCTVKVTRAPGGGGKGGGCNINENGSWLLVLLLPLLMLVVKP